MAAFCAGTIITVAAFEAGSRRTSSTVELGQMRLTPFAVEPQLESRAAWSADEKSVAYVRDDAVASSIVGSRPDGSGARTLFTDRQPIDGLFWLPDASRLYFAQPVGLRSVAVLGGSVRDEVPLVLVADISPDGRTLALWRAVEEKGETTTSLWTGPPGGPFQKLEPAPVHVRGILEPNALQFAPDGTKVLLWVSGAESALWIVPIRPGAAAKRVFEGRMGGGAVGGASWLPDSKRVVVSIDESLWLGDTESNTLTRFTLGATEFRSPAVSPSGDRILVTEQVHDYDVVELSLSGG